MKNFILLHLAFLLLLSQSTYHGQNKTQGGFFEKISDRFGNEYESSQLEIYPSGGTANTVTYSTCQSGLFTVHFANGSGFESSSIQAHIDRRNLVCEALENISGFLGWNSTWPSSVTVNINIDYIGNYLPSSATPSTSGVLGLASAFYAYPGNPASASPGMVENLIEKTIKSKKDAWNNMLSPFVVTGGSNYFHGLMAFNFENTNISWATSAATLATSTEYDLYTVILHEVTHALGFASLITASGVSSLPEFNPYFIHYTLTL
jgi:hypothetical protein